MSTSKKKPVVSASLKVTLLYQVKSIRFCENNGADFGLILATKKAKIGDTLVFGPKTKALVIDAGSEKNTENQVVVRFKNSVKDEWARKDMILKTSFSIEKGQIEPKKETAYVGGLDPYKEEIESKTLNTIEEPKTEVENVVKKNIISRFFDWLTK